MRVLSYRYGFTSTPFDGVLLFTSTDGGATFGPGQLVGSIPFYDAVSGPGASVSLITSAVTEGMLFQNVPTDGSSVGTQKANFGTTHPYLGTVALIDGTTPLASSTAARAWACSAATTGAGNLNDAGLTGRRRRTSATPTTRASRRVRAASSSSSTDSARPPPAGPPLPRRLRLRRRRSPVGAAPGESAQDYMTQDPGGQLHVLLPQITADGSRLMHATSDDGVTWTPTQHAFEPLALQTRAAVAADHTGVAVWESASNPPIINVMAISGGAAAPVLGRTVSARVVRGTVLVGTRSATIRGGRAAGGGAFRTRIQYEPAARRETIPVGSFLNTKRGTVELVSATGRASRTQSGQFSSGLFQVLQSRKRSAKGLTELRLKGGSFGKCRARGGRASAAELSRRTIRRLRANAKGRFRTGGRNSSATVARHHLDDHRPLRRHAHRPSSAAASRSATSAASAR